MKFLYNSGQRPLEGFTIKRGIGRGGFGEVYYAVSDGGKEVALKLVNSNHDVELRGMAQCLNLKHPHLVSLFDIKSDSQGDHWVVMEYISGESLSAALQRHSSGLPAELVQQWFVALAKAVGYLHDHGIVHRDLKPANIFLENGMVKVGDYGLCKFISSSQRNAQTQSVGTVHYMAPEISTGNYNKQIDVYAAGIILYEMLTGKVPFDGESAGEILMKHLTSPPNLADLEPGYQNIVAKALAKNPAHRYGNLNEMAKAVESVGKVDVLPLADEETPRRRREKGQEAVVERVEDLPTVLPVHGLRSQASELCGSMVLAAFLSGVSSVLCGSLDIGYDSWHQAVIDFFLTLATCWGIMLPAKYWGSRRGDSWSRRLVTAIFGLGIGVFALFLDGWTPRMHLRPTDDLQLVGFPMAGEGLNLTGYIAYFTLAMFALRWWKLADRRRAHRFGLGPIFASGILGLILGVVMDDAHLWQGMVPLVASSVIVQLVSPWESPAAASPRRLRLRYAG